MPNFKSLRVWHDAMALAENVYAIVRTCPSFSNDYALKNQISRAVISIPSNIAEGDERGGVKEKIYFLNVSKGSAAEVITQLNLAYRLGYIDEATLNVLENQAEMIRASIKRLIKVRSTAHG